MLPKFSREGRVAGYLGQCPKYDRIFILIASLRGRVTLWGISWEVYWRSKIRLRPSGNVSNHLVFNDTLYNTQFHQFISDSFLKLIITVSLYIFMRYLENEEVICKYRTYKYGVYSRYSN